MVFAGFFLFVMAVILAAGYWFAQLRPASEGAAVGEFESTGARQERVVAQALQSLGETIPIKGQQADALRLRLFRAGYRDPQMITVFQGARAALALLLSATMFYFLIGRSGQSFLSAALASVAVAGAGSLLPDRWLDWRVKARANRIRRSLAPTLEMLTLAVEAGQTLDYAIQSSVRSLRRVHGDLCDELTFYLLETRAGTPRMEALARMAERCREPELKKLAGVLADSERFGAGLGPALRSHCKHLRSAQRFQAQAAARKLSVKLVFPVFFLIFPAVLVVTLAPAYLQIQQFFRSVAQ